MSVVTLSLSREPPGGLPCRLSVPETVVVIDFGAQYSMLISRRIRECRVYCEIVSPDTPWEDVKRLAPKGLILSGGPASVYEDGAPSVPAYVYESGLPVLGICYGMQAIAHDLGGDVRPSPDREYGAATVYRTETASPLFAGLPDELPVWMSHGDRVLAVPAWIPRSGIVLELACRRDGEPIRYVCHPVPSRSRSHTAGQENHRELPGSCLRLRSDLDRRQLHRAEHCRDSVNR